MSLRYLLRRLLQAFIVVLGITLVVFALSRLTGDPIELLIGTDSGHASQEQIERLREKYRLNDPILVQYAVFLRHLAVGDLGQSLWTKQPALEMVTERLPATAQLAGVAFLIAAVVGSIAGTLAGIRRNSLLDRVVMGFSLAGQSIPNFWLGVVLILIFAVWLGWLPSSGRGSWQHLILPAATLAAFYAARIARVTRAAISDELTRPYLLHARAKGLSERQVIMRHVLKNAAIPVVTVLALDLGHLLSGSVVIEAVFAWPGVGYLIAEGAYRRDFPLLQAATIVVALIIVIVNLLTDLLYVRLNPRVAYS